MPRSARLSTRRSQQRTPCRGRAQSVYGKPARPGGWSLLHASAWLRGCRSAPWRPSAAESLKFGRFPSNRRRTHSRRRGAWSSSVRHLRRPGMRPARRRVPDSTRAGGFSTRRGRCIGSAALCTVPNTLDRQRGGAEMPVLHDCAYCTSSGAGALAYTAQTLPGCASGRAMASRHVGWLSLFT